MRDREKARARWRRYNAKRRQDPEYREWNREYQKRWAARKRAEDTDFAERSRDGVRRYRTTLKYALSQTKSYHKQRMAS